jgi:hypothetical protein
VPTSKTPHPQAQAQPKLGASTTANIDINPRTCGSGIRSLVKQRLGSFLLGIPFSEPSREREPSTFLLVVETRLRSRRKAAFNNMKIVFVLVISRILKLPNAA